MRYLGLICWLGLAPVAAHAWDCPPGTTDTSTGCVASGSTVNLGGQGQSQTQGQSAAGGNASQAQTTSSTGGAGGSANNNASTTGGSNVGDQQTENSVSQYSIPKDVATAYAPVMVPTAPCFKPWGGGAQTTFAGLSVGGGKVDKECEQQLRENGLRANAQALAELGERRLAVMTICAIPSEREALGAECVYQEYHLAPIAPMPCTITSPSPCESPPVPAVEERVERQQAHGFPKVDK